MLLLRGIVFALLVPAVLAVPIPQELTAATPARLGLWRLGWLLIAFGASIL